VTIRWFGQSAFALSGDSGVVVVDPFGEATDEMRARVRWDYPAVTGIAADLLLVTHEHFDHSGVEGIGGDPHVIRSTTGTWETPLGTVVGVASEHDEVAGTKRGPNTIFVFELDRLRLAHFGDFGQPALRPEQRAAIGDVDVDVLFLPVGDGPTVGGERAAAIVRELRPRLVVPMHYRTPSIGFLEPPDAFLAALTEGRVERVEASEAELGQHLGERDAPVVLLLAAPAS
jgi:L-ascorbate metabolism protein UlaG (beta-lactamase superfamily)